MNKISIVFTTFLAFFMFQTAIAQKTVNEINKFQICTGGVVNSKATYFPQPEYPNEAKEKDISGEVKVRITIDEQGNVEFAKVCSGHPLLRFGVEEAGMKAKFQPTTLAGQPVKVSGMLIYKFPPNEEKILSVGIVNGKAKYLPTPDYPQEAKDFCASGQVEVEVLIGEDGNVISAKVISGDELLQKPAVEAANKATFRQTLDMPPVKTKGIIVYNFVSEKKCIEMGIVNSLATYLPFPELTEEAQKACVGGKVEVAVLINPAKGEVILARAISGDELLRKSSEDAALKAKFNPAMIHGGKNIYVKAKFVYGFAKPKCITSGTLNEKALNIPKPQLENAFRNKHLQFTTTQSVMVRIIVNENGEVISAKAMTGHPLLRPPCEESARQAKFPPLDNTPLSGVIVYKVKTDGTVEF